ncbi:antitoxin [Enterovirga aerilata]|uniref:AbrB/MazE/SpoVT family DNA-binding domain-containing protein n=1 Tax=Enterovirga aerilata TaxID=2730920 RepID=A0A849I1R7_9HYPH|nr:AbrB/MazE/SpoVT family DNA-binding domain-containing protein [Enterovirga sp. DB1703]NNM71301.1 AbrB/MazE/SpoVT family DNA-binding domain-containing protein [Enterovirga sp. DB1703]
MLERKVSLFRNGRSQAVRIPKEFELPGNEAVMRQEEGGRLVIEPTRKETLLEVLDRLEPVEDPWPEFDDPLPEAVDL